MTISALPFIGICLLAPLFMQKKGHLRRGYHLVASCAILFIFSTSWIHFSLTLVLVIIPYFAKKIVQRKGPIILFILIAFIYLNQYRWVLDPLQIPMHSFSIIGLSYIVFRQIDVLFYEGSVDFVDYLSYVISFYTLLAGPIERFESFTKNLSHPSKPLDFEGLLSTFNRIINGYFKCMILSALLKQYADQSFNHGGWHLGVFAVLNGAYITLNFSGYCDIVIGFARLAGLELHENFNKPYRARTINDFWNRQHITLTQWITDYIFTPLVIYLDRLNRLKFNTLQMIAFFITFLIAGLWHGSTKDYLIYGLIQAVGICLSNAYLVGLKRIYKTQQDARAFRDKWYIGVMEWMLTQTIVMGSFMFVGTDFIERVGRNL